MRSPWDPRTKYRETDPWAPMVPGRTVCVASRERNGLFLVQPPLPGSPWINSEPMVLEATGGTSPRLRHRVGRPGPVQASHLPSMRLELHRRPGGPSQPNCRRPVCPDDARVEATLASPIFQMQSKFLGLARTQTPFARQESQFVEALCNCSPLVHLLTAWSPPP